MEITFKTKKLEKLANDYKSCQRVLGPIRAKLFNMRISDMRDVLSLEAVRNLPGKYHELTGNRKGQWSCDLDQPYRLIFEPHEYPIPILPGGSARWIEIKGVEIIEIVDYH